MTFKCRCINIYNEGVIMKTKQSNIDNFIYNLFCILSGGIVWVARIIISEAIRKAFKSE